MRTFHTSGSANLEMSDYQDSIAFIRDHLLDIDQQDDQTILHFDGSEIPESLTTIPGYVEMTQNGQSAVFRQHDITTMNTDVVSILKNMKELIRTQPKVTMTPEEYYSEMISYLSMVGVVYSSYVEILFANMFLTDVAKNEFWRYNRNKPIQHKLGDKTMAMKLSPLLGLLYEPNQQTIQKVHAELFDETTMGRSVYERIWLGKF